VFQIPLFRTPTERRRCSCPGSRRFAGSSYRLTAIATTGSTATSPESIGAPSQADRHHPRRGTWARRADEHRWRPARACRDAGVGRHRTQHRIHAGTAALLNVTCSTRRRRSSTVPDLPPVPGRCAHCRRHAIGAPGLDVKQLHVDDERDKLAMVSSQPVPIN